MAQLLPINFPIPSETAIASYNYTDIAEGTGIIQFYGTEVETGAASVDYKLVTNSGFYSSGYGMAEGTTQHDTEPVWEQDFDITFNLPKRIKGNCYIQVPMYVAGDKDAYIKCTIIHYDGSSETTIGTQTQSSTLSTDAAAKQMIFSMVIPVNTLTHFKKDETLRLNIELWCDGGAGAGDFWRLGHSPVGTQVKDSGGSTRFSDIPTRLSFFVPFILDI